MTSVAIETGEENSIRLRGTNRNEHKKVDLVKCVLHNDRGGERSQD